MRILQLHCDSIEYTPIKKEISVAEDIEPNSVRFDEIVVCFVAIEKDDDESVAQNAISEMECEKNTEEMKKEYEEGGGWKKSKMENIKE